MFLLESFSQFVFLKFFQLIMGHYYHNKRKGIGLKFIVRQSFALIYRVIFVFLKHTIEILLSWIEIELLNRTNVCLDGYGNFCFRPAAN